MRCKECDYPLWNLRSRDCPECGRAFLPSEYEFVADSVRFCCPECGQSYYGTGDRGHLVPESFVCVKCAHACVMDDMVLLPTEGVDEERTRVDVLPWLDREKRSLSARWFGTIGMALGSPGRLGKAIPADGASLRAAWFAFVTGLVYFMLGYAVFLLPIVIMGMSVGGPIVPALARIIAVACTLPIALFLILVLWSAATHGLLRATGSVAGSFSRTFSCLCYGSAANVLAAIPCVGGYMTPISWVWWAIASGFMLVSVHRISGWRAQLAVFVPPFVVVASLSALLFISIIPSFTTAFRAASQQRNTIAGTMAVFSASNGLRQYALNNNGEEPDHAIQLLGSHTLMLSDLYEPGSLVRSQTEMVGGVAVADVPALSAPRLQTAIVNAIASLDASGAHRLGDMVFVYRGVNRTRNGNPDPGLWTLVWAPLNPPPGSTTVSVFTTIGPTKIPIADWQASLAAQNALRTAEGLPAIPDPFSVGLPPAESTPTPP